MGDGCRLLPFDRLRAPLQERIRPAFEDTSFDIDSELCALRIQNDLWNDKTRRQFLQFFATPILFWRQAAQAALNLLSIDRILQALQFAFERADASKMALEQA